MAAFIEIHQSNYDSNNTIIRLVNTREIVSVNLIGSTPGIEILLTTGDTFQSHDDYDDLRVKLLTAECR